MYHFVNDKPALKWNGIIYLVVKIEGSLNWRYFINDLSVKPNRANLSSLENQRFCHCIRRSMYSTIFTSHQNYAKLIEKSYAIQRCLTLQKQAIRVISVHLPEKKSSEIFVIRPLLITLFSLAKHWTECSMSSPYFQKLVSLLSTL